MNVPIYPLLRAKLANSMITMTLQPDKKIEMSIARTKSSLLESRKGKRYDLNIPDAVYNFYGMPLAINYHKYGAILPAQNIIHATKMREKGYKNIGEVETDFNAFKFALMGSSDHPGLYERRDIIKAAIKEDDTNEQSKQRLIKIEEDIAYMEEQLNELSRVKIDESGYIHIEDIFNFLNKNLSPDVIFAVIERSVAEELRGMRDLTARFVQLFPYILTILAFFVLAVIIIMKATEGDISVPSIPQIIPEI
jgi:hypothetical protein